MTDKLIPRDISQSLGKLPPQATDLEEAVLGALMLESHAMPQVASFLRADHFYLESHKEIFRAIRALHVSNLPIDMRSVNAMLRKVGKIELVGGAYYIADLTSKVSSAASVEYHARVIVEMAVKRDLIVIASNIHNDAYEDTTDVFKLLDGKLQEITDLRDRTKGKTGESVKDLWETIMVTQRPPAEIPLIKIGGCVVATQGNHSLLVGKKKSRKTLFIVHLISEAIKMKAVKPDEILLFDTEQGRHHVWNLREKIFKKTGHHLATFYLRGQSPSERRDFIKNTVTHWKAHPKLIVIDGIRDLMSNINDADESTELIVWLEKLTLTHDLHVVNVLHLNKTDNNARGHIGTELLNKAQVTIELELDLKSNMTQVKCESSRDKPFDSFWFTHGQDEMPEVSLPPITEITVGEEDRLNRLKIIFDEGAIKRTDLIKGLRDHFSTGSKMLGVNRVDRLIAEFMNCGWIIKSGKNKDPNSTYKLVVHDIPRDSNGKPLSVVVTSTDRFVPPPPDLLLFDDASEPDIDPDALPF